MDNNFIAVFNDPKGSGDFRQWIKSHPAEIKRMNWFRLTQKNPSSASLEARKVSGVQEYKTIFANSFHSSEVSHDPINAKQQFSYELLRDQINAHFRIVWRSIYKLMNALIINARAATPTVAERMLLQREDVSATLWDGDSLLIYSCSEKGIDSLDNFSSGNIPAIRHQTFKAGPLRSPERERISLPLSILSTEMKHFEARNTFPNEMQKSEVDFCETKVSDCCGRPNAKSPWLHKIRVLDHVSRVAIEGTIIISITIALGVGAVLACRCKNRRRTKRVQVHFRVPELEDKGIELQKTTRGHAIPQRTAQEVQVEEEAGNKRGIILSPLRRSILRKTRTTRTK
ncbi:hypothetical protein Tcan_10267 [Toxocara canis]|uniref:Uncharacterized protein n=1 Tax=Toxocara canis TaxID=6265 RepID=A0A0B2UMP6_TOXCA|nr:hypothetical protein Tcan_10267 [Toxocara canis]